ncbi:HesA/MoeB/ThiF family protein [Neisseria sp. Ec49-e6-T10]|uniref:HesA/MoeB/ThiF family protein n=1 Tax=Neisseria sp. Ec49-e6-T10 TaxID=3140744 RepID=UPI003EBB8AC5
MPFKQEIKRAFYSYGFTIEINPPSFQAVFVKNYETSSGVFKISFNNILNDMSGLPKAYLVSAPERFTGVRLPHLSANKSICFIDEETTNLFPLFAERVIATCINSVEKIINLWASGDYKSDIQAEFSSYWEGKISAYLIISQETKGVFCSFKRTNLHGDEVDEIIIANDIKHANSWISSRNGNNVSSSNLALVIQLRKSPYVPYEFSWPPKSFRDFLLWLEKIDQPALQGLISNLIEHVDNNRLTLVCLQYESEIFAFTINTKGMKDILNRARGNKRKRGKSYKLKNLLYALSNNLMNNNFTRLTISEASADFLFQRNQPDSENLKNKTIALIGCGTIGGYTAQVLTQCGAGSGTGTLHLFDDDILTSGNLGRHILGKEYLDEPKSIALKHYIERQGLPVKVEAHFKNFKESNMNNNFDIIIDATGNYMFSVLLAKWYRNKTKNIFKTILIHGWIDAYGQAARVLKDDQSGGCYGCLSTYQEGKREPRFPLFKDKKKPDHNMQFKRKCGKTYLPFDSQPSLTVAGMILRMTLLFDKKNSIHFSQINFSDNIRKHDNQISLKPISGCPICQKKY